jgi:hypothetical protein
MTIVEIIDQSKNDLKINRDDLIHESARTPDLFSDYHKMYRAIRMIKRDFLKKLDIMEKDKYEYYSGRAPDEVYRKKPFGHKFKTKEIIMKYVNADEELLTLREKVATLEEKEDTIHTIMDQINNRSYQISNMIKSMEFFGGNQA